MKKTKTLILLQHEEILFNSKSLIVTNYRVRLESDTKFCSILLDNISSISVTSTNNYLLLAIGAMSLLTPFIFNRLMDIQSYVLCIGIGLICLIMYLLTMKRKLRISSNGGEVIIYDTGYQESEYITNLIEDNYISSKRVKNE